MSPHPLLAPPTTHQDIELNADLGLTLSLPTSRCWRARNAALRALNLRDCPHLQVLDLRACLATHLYVSVIACPRLRRIRLPDQARAVIHLDTGEQAPVLDILGGLIQVDARWTQGQFAMHCESGQYWQQAWIGWPRTLTKRLRPPLPSDALTLTVAHAQSLPAGPLDLNLEGVANRQDWRISGADQLPHLTLRGGHLQSLYVQGAPGLQSIRLSAGLRVAKVLLSACPALQTLDGPANVQAVHMNRGTSASRALTVVWTVDQLVVADGLMQTLNLTQPARVELLRCSSLHTVALPPGSQLHCEGYVPSHLQGLASIQLDENTLANVLRRLQISDAGAWPQAQAILPWACSPSMAPLALGLLAQATTQGVSPWEIWSIRQVLFARNQRPARLVRAPLTDKELELATNSWRWRLAPDLRADAWQADFCICLHALAAQVPGVPKLLHCMALETANENIAPLNSLLPWLLQPAQLKQEACQAFLLEHFTAAQHPSRHLLHERPIAVQLETAQALLAHLRPQLTKFPKLRSHLALRASARGLLLFAGQTNELLDDLEASLPLHPADTRSELIQLLGLSASRYNVRILPQFREEGRLLLITGRRPPRCRPPFLPRPASAFGEIEAGPPSGLPWLPPN